MLSKTGQYGVDIIRSNASRCIHSGLRAGNPRALATYGLQVFEGKVLTTLKLHLAAIHLPDQVRACGAGFFSLEFWVERMVQLLKRMIKYRSTAYPELLFIHDWLLVLACRRVRRTAEGQDLKTLEEMLEDIRAAKRKRHDTAEEDGTHLLGARRNAEDEEVAEVLPEYVYPAAPTEPADAQLAGLPQLLHTDPELDQRGWPTFRGDSAESRVKWIYSQLGLGGPFGEPHEHGTRKRIKVELSKFTRAQLPIGECVSSTQCRAQWKKNNQWGLVIWEVQGAMEGGQEGTVGSELCAVQFQYHVLAEYTTTDQGRRARMGAGVIGAVPADAEPLRLAVAKVYVVQAWQVPGMRPIEEKSEEQLRTELPEILHLADTSVDADNPAYCGVWAIDLKTINSQLVATKDVSGCRNFMIGNRSSGRTCAVTR